MGKIRIMRECECLERKKGFDVSPHLLNTCVRVRRTLLAHMRIFCCLLCSISQSFSIGGMVKNDRYSPIKKGMEYQGKKTGTT
jgi:hypothetical protein